MISTPVAQPHPPKDGVFNSMHFLWTYGSKYVKIINDYVCNLGMFFTGDPMCFWRCIDIYMSCIHIHILNIYIYLHICLICIVFTYILINRGVTCVSYPIPGGFRGFCGSRQVHQLGTSSWGAKFPRRTCWVSPARMGGEPGAGQHLGPVGKIRFGCGKFAVEKKTMSKTKMIQQIGIFLLGIILKLPKSNQSCRTSKQKIRGFYIRTSRQNPA